MRKISKKKLLVRSVIKLKEHSRQNKFDLLLLKINSNACGFAYWRPLNFNLPNSDLFPIFRPKILCTLIISIFSWDQKRCAYYEKSVTFELIPENEGQKLPKNLKFSPALQIFSKIIKKISLKWLNVEKNTGYLYIFRNLPLLQAHFVRTKRVCFLWGKCLLRVCLLFMFQFELEINKENAKNVEQAHECLANCSV